MHVVQGLAVMSAPWERALLSFQRNVVECGSSVGLEHAQRIGILFSNGQGSTAHLQRWVALLAAEDVPFSSLLVRALVSHHQWRTAMTLFQVNTDAGHATALGECLVDSLARRRLWEPAQSILKTMLTVTQDLRAQRPKFPPQREQQHRAPENAQRTIPAPLSVFSDLNVEHDDMMMAAAGEESVALATDPTYIPEYSRHEVGCGVARAICHMGSSTASWDVAVSLLVQHSQRSSPETAAVLVAMAAARATMCGQQYDTTRERIDDLCSQGLATPSLLRTGVRCALATENLDAGLKLLSALAETTRTHGIQRPVSSSLLEDTSRKILKRISQKDPRALQYLSDLSKIISVSQGEIYSLALLAELRSVFRRYELDPRVLKVPVRRLNNSPRHGTHPDKHTPGSSSNNFGREMWLHQRERSSPASNANASGPGNQEELSELELSSASVSYLDEVASKLLKEGRWKECLTVMESLVSVTPVTEQESTLVQMANKSRADWKTCLLFFSS